MGKRRYLKVENKCLIEQTVKKGIRTFKCKGLKRTPTAEEIIKELER